MNIEAATTALAAVTKALDLPAEGGGAPAPTSLKELGMLLMAADEQLAAGAPMEQVAPQLKTAVAALAELSGMGEMTAESDDPELPGDDPEPVMMSVKSMTMKHVVDHLQEGWGAITAAVKSGNLKEARKMRTALKETIKSVYEASFDKPVPVTVYKDPFYKEPPKTSTSISSAAGGKGARFIDPKGKVKHPGTSGVTGPPSSNYYEGVAKSMADLGETIKSQGAELAKALDATAGDAGAEGTADAGEGAATAGAGATAAPVVAEPVAASAVKSASWGEMFPGS